MNQHKRNLIFIWLVRIAVAAAALSLFVDIYNLAWALPVFWLGWLFRQAQQFVYPLRERRSERRLFEEKGIELQPQTIQCDDGVQLGGWLHVGQKPGTVIVLHGRSSNCWDLAYQSIALIDHGFSVLLIDLRAHGYSEGEFSTAGVWESHDLDSTIAKVNSIPELGSQPIGIYGFSLGGQIALRTAARNREIKAIALDGPAPVGLIDYVIDTDKFSDRLRLKFDGIVLRIVEHLTGVSAETQSSADFAASLTDCPLFVISTGSDGEQKRAAVIYDAAPQPKQLWNVPDAPHGGALAVEKDKYLTDLVAFFDHALLK